MIIDGWLDSAKKLPSTHFNERPDHNDISLLVIHNISLPPGEFDNDFVEAFFCETLDCSQHEYFQTIKDLRVSAHLYIKRSGELIQFVPLHKRAWHAGESEFNGRNNCNDFSIGIELQGTDDGGYTNDQYERLSEVTRQIQHRYPAITAENIVGHVDIAPQRKSDPGASFDWVRYRSSIEQIV